MYLQTKLGTAIYNNDIQEVKTCLSDGENPLLKDRVREIFKDVEMTCTTLPKPYVMVKMLPNESVHTYFCFVCIASLMYQCINTFTHLQTPKIPKTYTYKTFWHSSSNHIRMCTTFPHVAFRKTSIIMEQTWNCMQNQK